MSQKSASDLSENTLCIVVVIFALAILAGLMSILFALARTGWCPGCLENDYLDPEFSSETDCTHLSHTPVEGRAQP